MLVNFLSNRSENYIISNAKKIMKAIKKTNETKDPNNKLYIVVKQCKYISLKSHRNKQKIKI